MQEVANDWKFQVLHKHKLQLETDHEEALRLEEERRAIQENIENMKAESHRQLQKNMQDRIAEEQFQKRIKDEEQKRIQQKHIEENKESYKIARDIAHEKALDLEKKKNDRNNLSFDLLKQIGSNRAKQMKMMNNKRELESIERKRLEDVTLAQKLENVRKTNLLRSKVDDFREANDSFKKVQHELMKNSNFSFLDEGWKLEKEKIIESNQKTEGQKQANKDCSAFNQKIRSELEELKTKAETIKEAELRDRGVMEKQLRLDLMREGTEKSRKQQNYRNDIEQQILRNAQNRKSRENYSNEQLAQIKNYQLHLDQVDRKESENPIDNSNPFRI